LKSKSLNCSNSPHLALVLDQLAKAGELDEAVAQNILVLFETAVSKDGRREIGFSRVEGQSFNPRASRILLILLKDACVRDETLLALATSRAGLGEEYKSYLNLEEPLIVSAAFLLDRLRHLHLEKGSNPDEVYSSCLKAKELIYGDFPQIGLLLEKGVERMKRSIG